MPAQSSFLLQKWYFDGVNAGGETIIAYAARLRWRGIEVPYAGYLYLDAVGQQHSGNRFGAVNIPDTSQETIHWTDAGFHLRGQWTSRHSPIQTRLLETAEGYVDWHCLQPSAHCRIHLGEWPVVEGSGYAEYLEMTLPPWRLGLQELRWGRLADPEIPVVWIEWKGKYNRRWLFVKDQIMAGETISEAGIFAPERNLQLRLEQPIAIEDKEKFKEVSRALSSFLPGIERLAPLRFIRSRQTKWRSAGSLQMIGQTPRNGWVIHELVTF